MTAPPDSLAQVLEYLFENDQDDEILYGQLENIRRDRLAFIMKRLARVDAAKEKSPKKKKKEYEGQRSALKGRLYEQLVGEIVDGVQFFTSWSNVQSTTNEIDLLVMLGPKSRWLQATKDWGPHCVCECKYHATHVSNNWVTKLNTLLQTQGASVGLLFSKKGVASSGRGTQVRQLLQLLAVGAAPRFILCFSWDDLTACVNGEKFLRLVSTRYIEIRAGLDRLGLAAS